jgi:hypothetical protein
MTTVHALPMVDVLGCCDRCGARGQVRVVLISGLDLVFCGHHWRQWERPLSSLAVEVEPYDRTQLGRPEAAIA